MLVVLSDTHATDGHALDGRTLEAVREADLVVHAGDFTTVDALAAHREAADDLLAVHGNADDPAVRDRLPPARTVEALGLRLAVTHRRDGGATGLAMFGRSRDADVVVSGHSHRPGVQDAGDLLLLNPGSHADPRGNRPAHAELERIDGDAGTGNSSGGPRDGDAGTGAASGPADESETRVAGRLVQPDGTVFERFSVR